MDERQKKILNTVMEYMGNEDKKIIRNPERLDSFYDELKILHKTYYPDYRFGQLILCFMEWFKYTKGHDGFYAEEDKMLEMLHEYISLRNVSSNDEEKKDE